MASTETLYLDRLLDPVTRCFTTSVARQIVDLRADPAVQARLEELAEKCTEGQLSPEESTEYRTYVLAIDMIAFSRQKRARSLAAILIPDE